MTKRNPLAVSRLEAYRVEFTSAAGDTVVISAISRQAVKAMISEMEPGDRMIIDRAAEEEHRAAS